MRDERTKAVFPILQNAEQRPVQYELFSDTEAIYAFGDDLFIPVADSGIINENNFRKIKARYLVCGANAPFTSVEIEEKLFAMGKVVVPDFIANAGTAALYNTLMKEEGPVSVGSLRKSIETQIGNAADAALRKSVAENISPRVAAESIAAEKIKSYSA